MTPRPLVTLIVPMRNEVHYIGPCLESILAQEYPEDRLEVLVYDGGSTDGSWAIVERLAAIHRPVLLLHNRRRTQATAWNQGIARATGDIIGIVGAHSQLAPDYVATAVETLERTGADMVGGPMRADADGMVGRAVALATSTPFGVGDARFHYAETEQEVDTVYMGLCPARVYRALGFDEEMVRDQDDELSYRLLDQGGRIVCNPAIRSVYHNRATFRGLARQYFEYGYWKVRVMHKHPRQIRRRHLIPAAFVAALGGALLLAILKPMGALLLLLVGGSYVLANLSASVLAARHDPWLLPVVALVFATLHVAYGAGFLTGLARFGPVPRKASA